MIDIKFQLNIHYYFTIRLEKRAYYLKVPIVMHNGKKNGSIIPETKDNMLIPIQCSISRRYFQGFHHIDPGRPGEITLRYEKKILFLEK